MRRFQVTCYLASSLFLLYSFGENLDQSDNQTKDEAYLVEIEKRKESQNQLNHKIKALFDTSREEKQKFLEKFNQRIEEHGKWVRETKEKLQHLQEQFNSSSQEFHEKYQHCKEGFKQELSQKQEEFDAEKERMIEELKRSSNKPENVREEEEADLLKRHFRERMSPKIPDSPPSVQFIERKGQCVSSVERETGDVEEPRLFAFLSFSVPESIWLSLSSELRKVGGVFVIRGLPDQSFQTLACHLLELKEKGIDNPIQIDPRKFDEYGISQVPSFVVREEGAFDKISGNISLAFALERMFHKGETKEAKKLHQALREKA